MGQRTPEGKYTDSINRRLPKEIYHESCTSPFGKKGTPDQYYEAAEGVCRIEYKFIKAKTLPKTIELINPKKGYALSTNQQDWLSRAFYNGVTVAVVIGTKEESIVLATPPIWENSWTRIELEPGAKYKAAYKSVAHDMNLLVTDRDYVAKWIFESVM